MKLLNRMPLFRKKELHNTQVSDCIFESKYDSSSSKLFILNMNKSCNYAPFIQNDFN
jgi:hypothetical protein